MTVSNLRKRIRNIDKSQIDNPDGAKAKTKANPPTPGFPPAVAPYARLMAVCPADSILMAWTKPTSIAIASYNSLEIRRRMKKRETRPEKTGMPANGGKKPSPFPHSDRRPQDRGPRILERLVKELCEPQLRRYFALATAFTFS